MIQSQALGLLVLMASLLLAAGLRLPALDRWSGLVPWVLLWGLIAFAGFVVVGDRLGPHSSSVGAEGGADERAGEQMRPAPGGNWPAGDSAKSSPDTARRTPWRRLVLDSHAFSRLIHWLDAVLRGAIGTPFCVA